MWLKNSVDRARHVYSVSAVAYCKNSIFNLLLFPHTGYRHSLQISRAGVRIYPTKTTKISSDQFDPCMGDISDRIERELQLREVQRQRLLLEPECQSIRLEVLTSCRQTLIDLQTENRKDKKMAKLRSASKYRTRRTDSTTVGQGRRQGFRPCEKKPYRAPPRPILLRYFYYVVK